MEITIFAATSLELAPLKANKEALAATGHQFRFCETGVGMLQSTFYMQRHIHAFQPQLLLQIGVAGCFDLNIPNPLATAVIVEREYLGSLGVEEQEAFQPNLASHGEDQDQTVWKDIFDLGLQGASEAPFLDKALINTSLETWPWLNQLQVRSGPAVTIDEISTRPERIQLLQRKYHPIVESMEGAALHFNGLMHKTPFLQLRGISNYIGERDKSKWQIGPALKAVTSLTLQCLARF